MKMPRLIKRFLENWPVKIICLVLALFIYAFYQMSTLDSKTLSLPLSVISDGSMIQSSTITHYVRISVKGKTEDLIQVSESDFTVFLDLNHYSESGVFDVPVSVILSENATKINPLEFSCSPETISVTLEPRSASYAEVSPIITGAPAEGYKVDSISCSPDFIEISGPESIVEKMTSLQTKEVSLDQRSYSFTKNVELIQKNKFITIESGDSVEVTVTISPVIIQKMLSSSTGVFSGVMKNLEVSSPFPEYSIEISGAKNELEGFLLSMYSAQIDCTEIFEEGVYELPIKLFIPSDFTLISMSPQSASVAFTKTESKEINETGQED